MKEERFRQLFTAFGTLTDCSLKFTKGGKFRRFGFIGFKSEEEAQTALNHFNKSFIDMSRITVSGCESRPLLPVISDPLALSLHAQVQSLSPPDRGIFGVPHSSQAPMLVNPLQRLRKQFHQSF